MDFYHGSKIGGLIELKPFPLENINFPEPVVCLTTNKQLALHYIKDTTESPMLNICDDGRLIFQEMFSGALEYLYKGKSGYIYHCIGDYEINEKIGVMYTATSKKHVPVNNCEFIDDVYLKILEYEKTGMFTYEKYENLPQWRHDIIRGIVIRLIKKGNWINDPEHIEYKKFSERWPIYLKEAIVLNASNLL